MSASRRCLVALAAWVTVAAAAPREPVQDRIRWMGSVRPLAVYLPAAARAPAPLLLVLGPVGRSPRYAIESWRRLADGEGFIVAATAPEGRNAWTMPRDGPGFLRAVIERLAGRYEIDRRRVILFGDDAGGGFALFMGLMQPRYFAAAASFGSDLPRGALSVVGDVERPIPLYLYRGKRDPRLSLDELQRTADLLRGIGAAVEVAELRGLKADFEERGHKVAAQIWAALGRHGLDDEPRYRRLPTE